MLEAAPLATRTAAKWGLPMTELPGGCFDFFGGDRQPEILQSLQEQLVSLRPVLGGVAPARTAGVPHLDSAK